MILYIVRHGKAKSEQEDPSRSLTDEGKEETRRIASFLKKYGVQADEIWHSTKKRAEETAEILKSQSGLTAAMKAKDHLAPNSQPHIVYDEILKENKNVMIVGHLPFLDRLVSLFITGDEMKGIVKFKESAVAILEQDVPPAWRIAGHITPEMAGGL